MSSESTPRINNKFGNFNYLQNGNFDYLDAFSAQVSGADKWTAYDDGAVAAPVDGTGGSPTIINNAVVSSGQLRGLKSWTITKTGNAQGEGYASAFTIDNADKSMPLTISFDYSAGSAYVEGDLVIYVYDVTNSVLITPTITSLPVGTGFFQCSFNATSSNSYRLILHCATSSATTTNWSMILDNMRITNEAPIIGAAISDWVSFTSTITASGGGTVDVGTGNPAYKTSYWRRVGDSMEINFGWRWGTTSPQFGTSGTYRFSLPTGYTLDTTKIPQSLSPNNRCSIGHGWYQDDSTSNTYAADVTYFNGNIEVLIATASSAALGTTSPVTMAASDSIELRITVPISNWSSNINLSSTSTEYVYNSDVTGNNELTAFAYGPEGATLPNRAVGTSVTKRVRFKTPISPSDYVTLEVFRPVTGGGIWMRMDQSDIGQYFELNGKDYGAHTRPVNSVPTDMDVIFGTGGYSAAGAATYGANGNAWSVLAGSTWRWRLRKSSAANVVQVSGTVTGTTSGIDALAGQVGEYKVSKVTTPTNFPTSATTGDIASITLSPGDWDISAVAFHGAGAATVTRVYIGIGTVSGNDQTGMQEGDNTIDLPVALSGTRGGGGSIAPWRVNLTTTTTYYLKLYSTYSGGTPQYQGRISARRMR